MRYAIDSAAATADFSQTPRRARFVILQGSQVRRATALKRDNPALKVLLYKDLSFMQTADGAGNAGAGVTTQEAEAHPEWYLLDTAGRRFTSSTFDYLYAADVGSLSYQQKWADNALAMVRSGPWDGVFADDTNATLRYHHAVSDVAQYPTDAAYQAATESALATIAPRFAATGKLLVPNFGAWREYPDVVGDWLGRVGGGMDEMFVRTRSTSGDGYLTGSEWQTQLDEVKRAAALGKEMLAISHGAATDAEAARYGYATVLLGGQGLTSFALHDDYTTENWFPEYDLPIGTPIALEHEEAGGVHRRVFSNGLVLVNPTMTAVTVSLGGSYSGSGLAGATTATMAPHSGLVLQRA